MGYNDIAWKESLEFYLEYAMALLFPEAHAQIDWSRGYEFLDKELQQIVREGEGGTRLVDKLVKIWLKDGQEQWILLHIEVQGQPQEHFGRRMYTYNYRIFDRYGRLVASFAILADDKQDWRPDGFAYNLLGCKVGIQFPVVKLLDFVGREAELSANPNPFAVFLLAFLAARRTDGDPAQRRVSKIQLVRSLYERGLGRRDVQELFRLIDWLMVLPAEMERDVWHEIEVIEQEKQMQHLTPREQGWLEDGKKIGILEGEARGRAEGEARGRAEGEARARSEARHSLESAIEAMLKYRFGDAAVLELMTHVRGLETSRLHHEVDRITSAQSVEELRQILIASRN